jgi:hypothetical protein
MDELDATDLELIARFKARESPSPDAVERVLAGVHAQIAADGVRTMREWVRDSALTVAIAAAVLLGVRVVGFELASAPPTAPGSAEHVVTPAPVEVIAPTPPPTTTTAVREAPPPVEPAPTIEPAPKREKKIDRADDTPVAVDAETLQAELALLMRAKRAKDPKARLDALARHAERFPQGVLAEEREVLRIEGLCELDRRDEARVAAAAFTRAHPRSAFAGRVARSCAGATP